jgi:uridine phosphorylase
MLVPDLVLNSAGRIYHLDLAPGDVAETVLLVGDPARAKLIASYFDTIEYQGVNREINTYTGSLSGRRLTVLSTGMGTDNIEIVVNELDALFNIDLETRLVKAERVVLNLIRIGTSGALQEDIPVTDSTMVSAYGVGLDGLLYFYDRGPMVMERELTSSFINQMDYDRDLPKPYAVKGSELLIGKLAGDWPKGITITAPGFYAPQGRELRLQPNNPDLFRRAARYRYNGYRVTNFEMETSALYALSALLGHRAMTVCDIIANRMNGKFSPDYRASMKKLVEEMLARISSTPL